MHVQTRGAPGARIPHRHSGAQPQHEHRNILKVHVVRGDSVAGESFVAVHVPDGGRSSVRSHL